MGRSGSEASRCADAVDAASRAASVEVAAQARASQPCADRSGRTSVQSANSCEIVRAASASSAQEGRPLNVPAVAESSVVLNDAENPTRDRSQAVGCSALPNLTRRQHETLLAIEQWIDARGWPPSVAELGRAVGASSTATVSGYLDGLARKGYVRRDGSHRGLVVLVASKESVVEQPKAKPLVKPHLCDRCKREVG